jgi:NAD(P)-dependent dehydrogenase (short-subunit alcohol dehydrogenase family)
MAEPLFPLWQIDPDEYRAVCTYLRLTPQARLYDHLSRYLADAPFRFPGPSGFSRYLAEPRLTRFRLARLDPMTKLFLPGHPLRHALNGVIALHECDPRGYRELAVAPLGWQAGFAVVGQVFRFGVNLAVSLPWLGWQWLGFAAGAPFRAPGDLVGKRALITGVSRGLGRDLMLRCLEGGAEVIGVVRNRASRETLQGELPAHARVTLLVADLSTPGALRSALIEAQIPADSVAIAILSAAIKYDGKSVLSTGELRDTFQVNFFAAVELADWLCGPGDRGHDIPPAPKADAPASPIPSAAPAAMASSSDATRQRGLSSTTRVVLISSMGRWHGMHFSGGYNASKAALSIWGESLDMELRQRGKRHFTVTVVEPGIFASGMTRQTPVTRLLFASRPKVAARILAGALAGRRAIRPPRWFALLTWGICLIGRDYRYRLLARAKPRADR